MSKVTREDGHLVVAAIRVLAYKLNGPPTPEQVAELLGLAPETVRLQTLALQEAGIVKLVTSAYENHLEVRDHALLDGLESDARQAAMDEALAEFDQHKQEEAERMSRLFSEGEHERRRRDKFKEMDKGLGDFERKKPRNPFGDD
ncbi:hypothetical protein KKG45_14430 [bacterium]|nr:hypothetical protein [bacterium]MBU1074435.1 hypothetical protein [bacterium]MBU1676860.1 hypothetical protein [bacterium]